VVRGPEVKKSQGAGKWKQMFKVEPGKPPFLIIIILVTIAIILATWGILRIISLEHEIEIIIECNEPWDAEIIVQENSEYIHDEGRRMFSYTMMEGQVLWIYVFVNSFYPVRLDVTVIDNGEAVIEESSFDDYNRINIEYTV
jgi:hypothetical protein